MCTRLSTAILFVICKLLGSMYRCPNLGDWFLKCMISSVQLSRSGVSTLCDPMNRSTPGLPVRHQLRSSFRLTSIESVMPSSHLILCCLLLLLPPNPPSIRVFSNESTFHMKWPKYWSFSFSIIPSKEIPGLISTPKLLCGRFKALFPITYLREA